MPKIGKMEYPSIGIGTAIDALEKFAAAKVSSLEGAAEAMGHTGIKSGAFISKIASLTSYFGLIDRNSDGLKLSDLGKRILYPDNSEQKRAAIAEAILRVPLYARLYEKLGRSFSPSDFALQLREITGIERDESAEIAPTLENSYKELLPFLQDKIGPRVKTEMAEQNKIDEPAAVIEKTTPLKMTTELPEGYIRLEIAGRQPIIVEGKDFFIDALIEYLNTLRTASNP